MGRRTVFKREDASLLKEQEWLFPVLVSLGSVALDTALRREGVRTPALSPPITLSITLSGTEVTALGPERTRWRVTWSENKESAYTAADLGSISGSGRCPGGGSDNPLTYSRLGNPMDRGVRWVQSMGSQRVGHDWATNTRRKGDDLDCVFCRSVHTWRDVKVKSPSPAQSWSSIQREMHTH